MKSWILKHYNDLLLDELYLILKIRQVNIYCGAKLSLFRC